MVSDGGPVTRVRLHRPSAAGHDADELLVESWAKTA